MVKKKKKKVKESYINMMSYPHAQDSSTSKSESMTRQEKRIQTILWFILKDLLVVSRLKYLLTYALTKFSQKLPLKYALTKFMITLGNGQR